MSETRDKLMDVAESSIRLRGYHAVSFRELADELGIKSASVHYHFRTKEDLGLALVQRYSEMFFEAVDAKAARAKVPGSRIRAFAQVYRDALVGSEQICLCGMLGAESCGLPPVVSTAVAEFFQSNIDWLIGALPTDLPLAQRRNRARHIVAALQGGMTLASSLNDHGVFDSIVQDLLPANI